MVLAIAVPFAAADSGADALIGSAAQDRAEEGARAPAVADSTRTLPPSFTTTVFYADPTRFLTSMNKYFVDLDAGRVRIDIDQLEPDTASARVFLSAKRKKGFIASSGKCTVFALPGNADLVAAAGIPVSLDGLSPAGVASIGGQVAERWTGERDGTAYNVKFVPLGTEHLVPVELSSRGHIPDEGPSFRQRIFWDFTEQQSIERSTFKKPSACKRARRGSPEDVLNPLPAAPTGTQAVTGDAHATGAETTPSVSLARVFTSTVTLVEPSRMYFDSHQIWFDAITQKQRININQLFPGPDEQHVFLRYDLGKMFRFFPGTGDCVSAPLSDGTVMEPFGLSDTPETRRTDIKIGNELQAVFEERQSTFDITLVGKPIPDSSELIPVLISSKGDMSGWILQFWLNYQRHEESLADQSVFDPPASCPGFS